MTIFSHYFYSDRRGVTLLLTMVLLAAFLSIAMGIINILLGQIILVGQAGESFTSLYAADRGMERTLYRDRATSPICGGADCNETVNLGNGSCFIVDVTAGPVPSCPDPLTRCIVVTGQDTCNGSPRFVQRKFDIKY